MHVHQVWCELVEHNSFVSHALSHHHHHHNYLSSLTDWRDSSMRRMYTEHYQQSRRSCNHCIRPHAAICVTHRGFLESAAKESTLTGGGRVHRSYKHIVHLNSCRTYTWVKSSSFLQDLFLNLTVKKFKSGPHLPKFCYLRGVAMNEWKNEWILS